MINPIHDFSAFSTEHEDDYLELGEDYSRNRKDSFVDLLSYGGSILNYTNDLLNLDSELDNVIHETSSKVPPLPKRQKTTCSASSASKIALPAAITTSSSPKPSPFYSPTKMIGPLSQSQRKLRVEKYLEKKKKRIWSKRVHYDCRKRVAQNRLRVKGRFVTKTGASINE